MESTLGSLFDFTVKSAVKSAIAFPVDRFFRSELDGEKPNTSTFAFETELKASKINFKSVSDFCAADRKASDPVSNNSSTKDIFKGIAPETETDNSGTVASIINVDVSVEVLVRSSSGYLSVVVTSGKLTVVDEIMSSVVNSVVTSEVDEVVADVDTSVLLSGVEDIIVVTKGV